MYHGGLLGELLGGSQGGCWDASVAEPRINRYGYWLADPVTGQERRYTRATTWAKTISDTYHLTQWEKRMVAKGVATREDLLALAASASIDDKNTLDDVAQQAKEAVGGSTGRNLGDALHKFTARLDRGEEPAVPVQWRGDVECYQQTLEKFSVRILPQFVERIVVLPDLGIAGTFDRIVAWDPEWYIADVKTQRDLSYSWNEIAVQLSLYARSPWIWTDSEWQEMPPVSTKRGIVIHLPVGQAMCELYWIDLEAGWTAAQLAGDVRGWRTRKGIAYAFGVAMLGRTPVHLVGDSSSGAGARELGRESRDNSDGEDQGKLADV